jgi:hypothetical protein
MEDQIKAICTRVHAESPLWSVFRHLAHAVRRPAYPADGAPYLPFLWLGHLQLQSPETRTSVWCPNGGASLRTRKH